MDNNGEKNSSMQILNQLNNDLYGEDFGDHDNVNFNHYLRNAEITFYRNPIFSSLSKKFGLKDLSINGECLTKEYIMKKYIYIYIFLEIIYEKLRENVKEKDKLYDRINHIGSDNNFFGYIKLYTVYYATKFTKLFDHWFHLRFFSSAFLMLNIFEAVITDLLKCQFTNAYVGLYLALITPFCVKNFTKDAYQNIICDFDRKWLYLYTSWNLHFTYSDSPGKNYFPRTSICLLNSMTHSYEWLNNRAYVLFASHVLKTKLEFNKIFGLNDTPNPAVLSEWDNLNMKYISTFYND
jgi:hypothetical protein